MYKINRNGYCTIITEQINTGIIQVLLYEFPLHDFLQRISQIFLNLYWRLLSKKKIELLFLFQLYVGSVEPRGTKEEALQEVRFNQLVRYRVRFPLQNPLPKLTQIVVNEQVLCIGPPGLSRQYVNLIGKIFR